ncbi:MAG: hypothetical protein AzoDbin1_05237, partial [Azoarcus sp.]|nr:hypothetical protein [Azoarcus sp.]
MEFLTGIGNVRNLDAWLTVSGSGHIPVQPVAEMLLQRRAHPLETL